MSFSVSGFQWVTVINNLNNHDIDTLILGLSGDAGSSLIIPGIYATVGAAAFSGSVTHTVSICVIVFEMTGQINHCVPVLLGIMFVLQKLLSMCSVHIIISIIVIYQPVS